MPNTNPTIVSASLSDKELQASINQMVANFDKGLQTMLEHSNEYVGKIQESLQKIGNTNFGAKSSNDGGVAKQTKAQNDFTDAVKKSTNEIKRQNQETAMSFDQIAAALDKARRTVSDFNTKRASGILPSSEDYKRYEQALARIVEYNDKLKQSALSRADTNQWANAFDAKRVVSDLTAVDDRLKQLNKYYKEEEKQAQKTTAAIKENSQAKKENTSVGQPAKSARDSYIAFMQGYKQQAEQIRRLMEEEQKAMQQRRQGVVDGFTKTIEERKARVKELSEEIAKLYKERPDGYRDAIKQRTEEMNALKQKIRELTEAQKTLADSPIGASNRYLELEKEYHRIKNIMIDATNVQRQSTQETEKQTQAAQRYTDEIRKQAAAIRATKEWQEKGHVVVGDINYYDKERANVSKRDKQLLLSLEEQIVQAQQKEAQEALVAAEAKRQQAQAAKEAAQASKGVSAYDLGIDPNISAGRQRQIASTRVASKETEYLKQQVASLLEVEEREIKTANAASSSYAQLAQYLKNLQSAYQRLGADRIAKGEGTDLANEIQRTQRAMQKLQQTMSRPISLKDAMGLSEKTLDDIAYKMRQLSAYRSGLDVSKQSKEITQVNDEYNKLKKRMDEVMQKNQQMIASNTALGRSWNYMKNRLAFYFTVGAGMSFIRDLARVRSEYEMNEKALGTLMNSAERGTRIFNELSNMALVSPYTLIELSAAAKQLTAYDVAAKDVVDTTRRLADISAAVGIPVERLTYALGQVKAYGHLTSQDARQFLNAGVPLVKELANRYTELEGKLVSTADVYDRMKKHAISYNDVLSVLTSMTDEGGRFFDYQAKMADTLKVRIANLTLAYNNMLNEIGRSEGGAFVTGIKGVTAVLKHWREIERVLGTIIVSIGAYRTATFLAGITTQKVGGHSVAAWLRLSRVIRTTQGNVALLSATMKAIPFAGWVTMIMSLVSYFVFFNNSTDETKQKLEDIATAFEGIRKEVTNLFADAISTDNIGTQMSKLKDILDLAETELGVTIPINLENVNESNIKQKLKEAKRYIDEYLNFSQRFSEEAVDTPFNEEMNKFGSAAKSTYTSISESINAVKVALKELADEGKASKRDIEILNELSVAPKDGESRIEHLQRMVGLYEELGLIGQKKVTPKISFFGSSDDNMEELAQRQENALDRLGIKNKTVYENMLKDVQNYYSSSSIASYQLEQQVMRVAESIDIMNIPVEQRTMKLEVAINQEAAKNNWNDFEKEFAFQVANTKFGTTIEISEDSKKDAEIELSDWQKRMQSWADKHGISFSLNFMEKEDEKTYADRMLQAAKDARDKLDVLRRKLKVGTGSQTDVDNATKDYNNARLLALQAGADLSSLDKKSASSRKAASKAESELAKALKDELSTIDKVRSIYKDFTKEGMSHADAVERATRGWDETVNVINRVLQKNGLQKLDLSKFAGIENPRELVNMLQSQLNVLLKRGAKPAEIKELQTKIQTLNVDAEKYDLTKITKGLNNELDKLKDEYELAVELDANPEMGDMFADMFGINTSTLPKTFSDALDRAQIIVNRKLAEMNIATPFDLMQSSVDDFAKSTGLDKDSAVIKELVSAQNAYRDMFKKNIIETEKILDDYIKKYGDYSDKIAEIEAGRLEKLKKLNEAYYTEEMRKRPEYAAKLNAIEQGASKEKQQVDFDEFKNSRYYTMMFENLDYISTKTIRDMRDRVRELIDTMNDLTPEQLKTLMSQYEKLEQKLVKRSPFKTLTKDLKEYFATSKERKAANQEFKNAQKEYDAQKKNVAALKEKYEQAKAISNTSKSYLDSLQIEIGGKNEILKILKEQLDAAQKKADKYNLIKKLALEEASQVAQVVSSNLQSLGELRDFLQQDLGVELSDELNGLVDGLSKVGQGINKITSSATSGDVVGVITGVGQTVYGLYDSIASIFGGGSAADKKITKQIQDSERAVKRLELTYKNLEVAIENAFGANVIGAKQAAIANKELQLVELQRQLRLEKSRDRKHRDEDRIIELQGQIIDLRNEITRSAQEVVTSLLGISSVSDAAFSFMDAYIEALRRGEDAQKAFSGNWKEMVANMIKQLWVTKVIGPQLEALVDEMNANISKRSEKEAKAYEQAVGEQTRISTMSDEELFKEMNKKKYGNSWFWRGLYDESAKAVVDSYRKQVNEQVEKTKKDLLIKTTPTIEDMDMVAQGGTNLLPLLESSNEAINELLKRYGLFIDESESKSLSSLQQGLQSMSESTAESLEAYMNGVSQQVYLHSDLLTQIRDAVVGFDIDVQTASLSQILLQLQTNYIVMQSMHSMMENWTVPSGSGIRVELMS